MNRHANRTAFLIPDALGSFGVIVSGVLLATGMDRFTAQQWAVARGYRVRVLRNARGLLGHCSPSWGKDERA